MSVHKDKKTNTWTVKRRYTDWTGATKNLTKRGFALKRDAQEWEQEFLKKQSVNIGMSFASFYDLYKEDVGKRVKESTWDTKVSIAETHILPFFKDFNIQDITSVDIIHWQNEMMKMKHSNGKLYSQVYLKTIQNQLSAIFNHAVRHYGLSANPACIAGSMGQSYTDEMKFWTKAQYLSFSKAIIDKPCSYHCFELLYWCGIREGELLALTPSDFDFKKREVSINKTYHRIHGKDVITSPKTKMSIRVVSMPQFLCDEIETYIASCYDLEDADRLFPVTKSYLYREIKRGSALAGVEKIRVHDLRHSHVSLLIDMGYSAVAIAKRVGHKSIDITYRYAHMFPSVQNDIALDLDKNRGTEE